MNHKKRIGTILVEQGLITREQLERALRAQLMAGGHLGTSLIELGYIDEDGLAQALGRALNMRHATRASMEDLPADVLGLLDAQTVERFRAIPLGRGFRSIHVAVITPRDISSLSARTAHRIIPWITPEISVIEAMESYYGIPRPRRFLVLAGGVRSGHAGAAPSPPLSALEQAALHASIPSAVAPGLAVASDNPARPTGARARVAAGAASATPSSAAGAPPPSMTGVVGAMGPAQPGVADDSERPRWSFDDVSGILSNADSREELAAAVLDYAVQHMPGCVLFGVRDTAAYVWDWRGLELAPARISGLEFPVAKGSIFQLLRGEPFFQGPVPPHPQYLEFFEALDRPLPYEILLLPVHLNDRLIAVLYGEATDDEPISADMEDYLHLVSKVSMALNIIILKMKIRVG